MKILSPKALTMVELLVALVISSVLILMVGAISNIAFSSHTQLKNENDVYSDLFYGLSRLTFLAHKASALTLDNTWPTPPWGPNMLIVDNSAFGLYQPVGEKIYFVFVPDKTNQTVREPLLTQADTMSFTITPNGKSVTLQIQGTKNNESFTVSNFVVTRRNN
jgi:prepilin-type N-terminal cleavage/methylation domain-containing protein